MTDPTPDEAPPPVTTLTEIQRAREARRLGLITEAEYQAFREDIRGRHAAPPVTPINTTIDIDPADRVLALIRRELPEMEAQFHAQSETVRVGGYVMLGLRAPLDTFYPVHEGNVEPLAAEIVDRIRTDAIRLVNLEPVIAERVRRAVYEAQAQGRREGEERGRREGRAELMREWQEAAANADRLDTKGGLS